MNVNGEVTYRLLPADEWDRLRDVYPENAEVPSPVVASVVIAELHGEIVGYLVLQVALHMEPLYIKDHQADYRTMARLLLTALPSGVPYFSCVPNKQMEHVASELGMTPTDWKVYMGRGGA